MNFPSLNNFLLPRPQRGSILIVVLVFLSLLSLLALSVGHTVAQKLQVVSRLEAREKLRLVAEAAAQKTARVIREKISLQTYHALNQAWANSNQWKKSVGNVEYSLQAAENYKTPKAPYGLVDADRKINVNTAKPQILEALFRGAAGLDKEQARKIVASIRDWKDADEDLTDGGAESKDYLDKKPPYRSKNAPLDILEELLWVDGITPEIFSKVQPYLSLDGNQVNVNTASKTVLEAMGFNSVLAEKIISFRGGKDEEEGTADDGIFESLQEVPDVLGRYIYLNDVDRQILTDLLSSGFSVNSTCFTAQIFATLPGQGRSLRATASIDQSGGIKRWHEEFL